MKPTLKQIFDFGLETVETEYVKYTKNRYGKIYEYIVPGKKGRYRKALVCVIACDYYGYSADEVASYLKLAKKTIYSNLSRYRNTSNKKEEVDELYGSLQYLYGDKKKITLDQFKSKVLPIFANENNFNTRSPEDLNKLEKWLISRLYEIENK